MSRWGVCVLGVRVLGVVVLEKVMGLMLVF